MKTDIETTISRIIENEIFVNASTFVTDLAADETGKWVDDLAPACVSDDYQTPVREYIETGAYVSDLVDLADDAGAELTTKTGQPVDHDNAADYALTDIDTAALLATLADIDGWQAAAELLDVEPETVEALQHWLVSDRLADDLEQVGALVARDVLGFEIWGRTECGQSLTMDSDLRKVAELIEARLQNM